MKQYDHLYSTPHELLDNNPSKRIAIAAAVVALVVPQVQSEAAYAQVATGPTAPPPTASNVPRPPLPSNWPTSVTLGSKDCTWGAPIDHQTPLRFGAEVAAMVDTRCEPPREQKFAYVRSLPDTRAKAIGRVYNGQFVRLDCQTEGQPVGDDRGSIKNLQWFSVTFRNRDEAQRDDYGYVSGANLGQLDVTDADVPPCG